MFSFESLFPLDQHSLSESRACILNSWQHSLCCMCCLFVSKLIVLEKPIRKVFVNSSYDGQTNCFCQVYRKGFQAAVGLITWCKLSRFLSKGLEKQINSVFAINSAQPNNSNWNNWIHIKHFTRLSEEST